MKKLISEKGESLIETLVALMIVAMSLTILAGAIVTTARVNKKTDNAEDLFYTGSAHDGRTSSEVGVYTVSMGSSSMDVKVFISDNGYYFYEKN